MGFYVFQRDSLGDLLAHLGLALKIVSRHSRIVSPLQCKAPPIPRFHNCYVGPLVPALSPRGCCCCCPAPASSSAAILRYCSADGASPGRPDGHARGIPCPDQPGAWTT